MTWFGRKRLPPPGPEVQAELIRSEAQAEQAKEKHLEALSLAKKLQQIRERNHFGESLEGLYREKKC